MKKIEIEIPDGKRAEWVDGVLTLVDEKPEDVTERVKTFINAVRELGSGHPLVKECKVSSYNTPHSADTIAYLKLRIICAALNEGWQPKFTEDECRYYPWFGLYTKTELEDMSEENKKKLVIIDLGDYDAGYAGLAFGGSDYVPSDANTNLGSRLCLKSEKLAEYCGKQFISLWADYLLRRKGE